MIKSDEQYDSTMALLGLLCGLGLVPNASDVEDSVIERFGDEYAECACGNRRRDCSCADDDRWGFRTYNEDPDDDYANDDDFFSRGKNGN